MRISTAESSVCHFSRRIIYKISTHNRIFNYKTCCLICHYFLYFKYPKVKNGRSQRSRSLRSLACWDCGVESRRRHGCLSLVSLCVLSGRDMHCGREECIAFSMVYNDNYRCGF
jgi:hypothetical protein